MYLNPAPQQAERGNVGLRECVFSLNHASDRGGAVHISKHFKGTILLSRFYNNTADLGAGLSIDGATVHISKVFTV